MLPNSIIKLSSIKIMKKYQIFLKIKVIKKEQNPTKTGLKTCESNNKPVSIK